MANALLNEYKFFKQQPHNMRVLLTTNMTYAWVLPIIEIFVAAYIMRSCGRPAYVCLYQLAQYVGIVFTSIVNGWLLKHFKVKSVYCAGMLVTALSMIGMMMLPTLGVAELALIGFVMGAAAGLFWTNRYLVTLKSTNDDNRNYFFGLESLGFTIGQIAMPLIVGLVLSGLDGAEIFGYVINITAAYRIVTLIAFIIAIAACINVMRGEFENPQSTRYIYFKFCSLWTKMMSLAALKGAVQGFLVTAPSILIMKMVGDEGSLGAIQTICGLLTALIVYLLGRFTKPKHRIFVFAVGLIIFVIGTLLNSFMWSALGVILFLLCKVVFTPLHDLAYYPTMLRSIDVACKIEKRNEYTYIMSHEVGLFIGRAFGMILFLALAFGVSEDFALKVALPAVALLQMFSLPLAKNIIKNCDKYDTQE